MDYKNEKSFEMRLKEIAGVSNVESYCLVNNYGWTFEKKGHKFDVRFWANCYGVYLGYYQLWACGEKTSDIVKGKTDAENVLDLLPTIEAI